MTEDTLKERMAALEAQRRQMEANLNAIAGTMQECQFWLSKLKTPENQDAINAI